MITLFRAAAAAIFTCKSNQFFEPNTLTCQPCKLNQISSQPNFQCTCDSASYKAYELYGFASDSACLPKGSSNPLEVKSIYNTQGAKLAAPALTLCSSSAAPELGRFCRPCPSGMTYNLAANACTCPAQSFDNICFSGSSGITPTKSTWVYVNHFPSASAACINQKYALACQSIKSMCALNGYQPGDSYCDTFRQVSATMLTSDINANLTEVSLRSGKSSISVVVAEYESLTGKLVGLYAPNSSAPFGCKLSALQFVSLFQMGSAFKRNCYLDLSELPFLSPTYELFINTSAGFQPIPIIINGVAYVRFSPFDNILFRTSLNNQASASQVTVLSSVKVIWPNSQQVPTINLTYQSVIDINSVALISISTETVGSSTAFYTTATALFIVANVLAGLAGLYRLIVYIRINPQISGEFYYCCRMLVAGLVEVCQAWTVAMFVFLFVMSGYWFFFYKFQTGLFIFMTDNAADYQPFTVVFIVMAVLSLFSMVARYYSIANLELYFLDWECQQNQEGQVVPATSFWRLICCAKALRSIILYRSSNSFFSIIAVTFFIGGFKWQNLSFQTAYANLAENTSLSFNRVLLFFLVSAVYVAACALQSLARWALRIWYPLPQEAFEDLLSLSNLSLFIFDSTLHGHYVHGQHPFGKSQGPFKHHSEVLAKEAQGGSYRSFIQNQPQQTFQILVPVLLRYDYNSILASKLRERLNNASQSAGLFAAPLPAAVDYDAIAFQKAKLDRILKLYLEQLKKCHELRVLDKPNLMRITCCLPSAQDIGQKPLFYKEQPRASSSSFLLGLQPFLVIWESNIINFFVFLLPFPLQGVLIAAVLLKLFIKPVFQTMVTRNLAYKTLTDVRLLQ